MQIAVVMGFLRRGRVLFLLSLVRVQIPTVYAILFLLEGGSSCLGSIVNVWERVFSYKSSLPLKPLGTFPPCYFLLFILFYIILLLKLMENPLQKRVTFILEATVPQVSALRLKIHHVGSALL